MLSHYDNLLQTIEQVQAGNAGVIDSVIAGTHAETASMNSAMEAA